MLFHSDGGLDEGCHDEEKVYIDIGEDSQKDLRAELAQRVRDARAAGMSEAGISRLQELLQRYESVLGFG